jgi:outer membrane protein
MSNRRWLCLLAAIAPLCPTHGETLYDAIQLAYQTNPDLRSQRAELRAVGEGYIQARSGLGPQVNVNGQGGYSVARVQSGPSLLSQSSTTTYRGSTGSAAVSFVQPLFTFGAVSSQVRGAAKTVLAGREGLRQAEAEMIGKVITAYVDVRQDRAVLGILTDEISNLSREFTETSERGKMGEMTRTDVAEAEGRLGEAQAQQELARGRLAASEARYLAVVGQGPGELAAEPELGGVPLTVADALTAADDNNPQILQAVHTESASREKVNEAKAAFGPTVSMRVDAGIQPTVAYVSDFYNRSVSVAGVVSVPIFTSGLRSSKVREARARDEQAALQIESTRRAIVSNISQAWGQFIATKAAARQAERMVAAYRVAVEGNQVEQRVGRRSIFELLNTEVSFANARIQLLQNNHDEYLAKAALLSAMGQLEIASLVPGTELYDPTRSVKTNAQQSGPPWMGAVKALDTALSDRAPAPSLSPQDAGSTRPSTAAALAR